MIILMCYITALLYQYNSDYDVHDSVDVENEKNSSRLHCWFVDVEKNSSRLHCWLLVYINYCTYGYGDISIMQMKEPPFVTLSCNGHVINNTIGL